MAVMTLVTNLDQNSKSTVPVIFKFVDIPQRKIVKRTEHRYRVDQHIDM